jgi:hypothetical protein
MSADSPCRSSSTRAYSGTLGRDTRSTDKLPLSRRTELLADAFVAVQMIRLMNRIARRHASVERIGPSIVSKGIELTQRLQQGDSYLTRRRTLLIPHLPSVETAEYMRAHGTSNITAQTQEILPFLEGINGLLAEGRFSEIYDSDSKLVESTRGFFRIVHTSITDQLETVEPSRRLVDIG